MKLKCDVINTIFFTGISLVFLEKQLFADVVWPAIYVAASFEHFWYLVIFTIVIELLSVKFILKISYLKAMLISIVANITSSISGLSISVISFMGWHYVADSFVGGTFGNFNSIFTIIVMFLISVFIETIIVKIIWKFPITKTVQCLSIGNILSYIVIVIYLYKFGGWNIQL